MTPAEKKKHDLANQTHSELIGRNVRAVVETFNKDPYKILVSVQLANEQVEHLTSGLTRRSRRLIPLPTFVTLIDSLLNKPPTE